MDWKNLDKSRSVKICVASIAGIVIVIISFQAGVFVGYKKAAFSFRGGDNYYRAFGGHSRALIGMDNDDLPASYGAAGKIVKVNLPEIIIADRANVEKTIIINDDTIVKEFKGEASSSAIHQDDFAVVIGTPNNKSQIEAKLIRIIPPPPIASTTTQ
jgi:hypothetical protein